MHKLLAWLTRQLLELKRVCFKNYFLSERGGGDDPEPPPAPAAPTAGETTAEAIDAQINALPDIFAAQQLWGPQFSQQQLEALQTFGPQYAQAALDLSQQFGPQFAQEVLAEQAILDPSRVAGSEAIASYLEQGYGELSDEDKQQIMQNSLSARSATGMGESGMTADEIVNNMFGAREALKSRYLNVGLAAAGRLPAAGGQTVQVNPAAYGTQMVQNVTPSEIFGYQGNLNNFNASLYNTQGNIYGTQMASGGSPWGSILGGIAGSFAGGAGGAWGASLFSGS